MQTADSTVPQLRFARDETLAVVDDGATALAFYLAMCAGMGVKDPPGLRE